MLFAGFGVSVTYTASSTVLALHFKKYSTLAFSVAVLGIRVGHTMWPVVSQYLLTNFGYSQAMGILAIPHVSHLIVGILFFEPSSNEHQKLEKKSGCSEGR